MHLHPAHPPHHPVLYLWGALGPVGAPLVGLAANAPVSGWLVFLGAAGSILTPIAVALINRTADKKAYAKDVYILGLEQRNRELADDLRRARAAARP